MQTSKVRPEPKIPDHEVLRKIGGGAYGEVWLARGVTGALRAVKTVWYNDFDDERGFEREFEGILKYEPISRDHPGLVHILHVGRGESEGEPFYYYVMELGDDVTTGREINAVEYEPRTLRSDMKAAGGNALDVEECISAGRVLAEGLEHLHQHGLAHRDVKPSNVIFVDGKAKLADIGLVALRGQQTFVGTEGFVPPEGPGSAQADVYSLGKVLYEMATGKDRLDFPELPDELPEGPTLKRWRLLNSVICDVCEPKISRRKIKSAGELATELAHLEGGRRRPARARPGLVATLVFLGMVLVGVTQILSIEPMRVNSPGPPTPPKPEEKGIVSITSVPPGAQVFSEDGELLGVTPMEPLRDYPVDSIVKFVLRMPGFADQEVGGVVPPKEEALFLSPELEIYDPPVPGDPWKDVFKVGYQPRGEYHISQYYVSEAAWQRFEGETDLKGGQVISLTESGMDHRVVLANEDEAQRYVEWLEEQNRDSYLDPEHWMEFEFDKGRDIPEAGENPTRWPFYVVVRKEVSAEIYLASDPPGADIYINGEKQDVVTTRDGVLVKATWRKGERVEVIIEKDKFKQYDHLLLLKPGEAWTKEQALQATLEPENVFETELENSLGMRFVPLGSEKPLLVSIWETRIQDYQNYVKAMKSRVPDPVGEENSPGQLYPMFVKEHRKNISLPPEPDFGWQGPSYPIVNITRRDAEMFCRWLTLYEQRNGDIEKNHEYRLPTDEEWSLIAGISNEGGLWPIERDGLQAGLWWGETEIPPPPPEGAGNFSDESAEILPEEQIRDYNDGYAFTAPVGSFPGRPIGSGEYEVFDLAGNVLEWIAGDYSAAGRNDVARGACWKTHRQDHLKISSRHQVAKPGAGGAVPDELLGIYGFRVVLAKVPVIPEKEPEEEEEQ